VQLIIKWEKLWAAHTDELLISLVWNTLQKERDSIIDGDWQAAGLPKNLCFIKSGWNYGQENSVPQSRCCIIVLSYKLNCFKNVRIRSAQKLDWRTHSLRRRKAAN